MFQKYGWFLLLYHFLSRIRFLLIFLTALLYPLNVVSDGIDEVTVYEKSGVYHIKVSATIDASEEHIRRVVTDFTHAYRINNSIIESEVLPSLNNEITRVRARVLCCTDWFCREAERVDDVRTLDSGEIHADIVPAESDFYSGTTSWKFIPRNNKTQLIYQASIEPAFFIPPIIGKKMVVESLKEQFIDTFSRIERVAKINEVREWNDDFTIAANENQDETKPCNDNVN